MRWRTGLLAAGACAACLAVTAAAPTAAPRLDYAGAAWSILPAGEDGGLTLTKHSTDQAKLYDALTPLRGNGHGGRHPALLQAGTPLGRSGRRRSSGSRARRRPHASCATASASRTSTGRRRPTSSTAPAGSTAEDRGLLLAADPRAGRASRRSTCPGYDPFAARARRARSSCRARRPRLPRAAVDASSRRPRPAQLVADVDAYVGRHQRVLQAPGRAGAPVDAAERRDRGRRADRRAASAPAAATRRAARSSCPRSSSGSAPQGAAPSSTTCASQKDPEAPATIADALPVRRPDAARPGNATIDAGSLTPASAGATAFRSRARRACRNVLARRREAVGNGHPLFVAGPAGRLLLPRVLARARPARRRLRRPRRLVPGHRRYVVIGRGKDFAWSATSSRLGHHRPVRRDALRRRRLALPVQGRVPRDGHVRRRHAQGRDGSPTGARLPHDRARARWSATRPSSGRAVAISHERSTRGRELLSALAF